MEAIERKIEEVKVALLNCRQDNSVFLRDADEVLKRLVKPLLEAGQAMAEAIPFDERFDGDKLNAKNAWDATLAPAQAGKGAK